MGKNKKKKNNVTLNKQMDKTQKFNAKKLAKKQNDKTQKFNAKKVVKKEKKTNKKHPKLRLAIKIILILILLAILIGGGILAGIVLGWFGDDLKLSEDELKVSHLNTEIYDREGNLIETLTGDESRKWIDYGNMAEYLPTAFVSIEDERFFEHQGVDIKRTIAATAKYILSKIGLGSSDYGGSTITQQLVKNLTKEDERDAMRKIKEMGRAANLEKTLSKEQILELYLNLIFLGGQSYGVEMGSQYYFSKSASELSLAECAFLAGINNAPNAYDAFSDDEEDIKTIKNRTKTVLVKMKELGNIKSEEDYNTAMAKVDEGLDFKNGGSIPNVYSYHTDAAIDQILDQLAEEHPDWSDVRIKQYLYGGGLKIYTTQNSWVQAIAEDVVADERFQEPSDEYEGKVTQAAMVIIDHKTGQVLAVVGGTGEKTVSRGFNFATMQPRQTGSAMKPISVIAPAIQDEIITAGSVYDDAPSKIGGYSYGWPVNYDGTYFGLTTVRTQIQESHNIVPCKILNEMGIERSIEYLKSCGVTTIVEDASREENDLGLAQLALGGLTEGITPLQVAGAYAAIANNGEYIEPTFYTKIEDSEGKIVLEPHQERRRVLSEEAAYVVQMILRQPVIAGTATYCAIDGIDVCAKTGTTEDNCDRWLCGFTPYFTASTWFGYEKRERITGFGTNPAGQIWSRVMDRAHEGLDGARFEEPANISYATICSCSGLLATELCAQDQRGSQVYTEVYIKGTTPSKRCDCHVKMKAHQVEGGTYVIANDYCPNAQELVFITRENANSDDWWRAEDAKYMAPMQACTLHKKPVETPKANTITNDITNSITNTTTNSITNNTTTNSVTNTTTNTTTPKASTPATKTPIPVPTATSAPTAAPTPTAIPTKVPEVNKIE